MFLGTCYVMVVLALLEYALVAYSNKKRNDQIRKWKKMEQRLAQQKQPVQPQPDLIAGSLLCLQPPLFSNLRRLTPNFESCGGFPRAYVMGRAVPR